MHSRINPLVICCFVFIAVLLLSSCGNAKKVVTLYQKDTTYITVHDKEAVRDSIYIDRFKTIKEKGDTVYITDTQIKYRDKWREKEVHDTTYVEKIKTETITKEVEKKLNRYQKTMIGLGWTLIVLLLAALGYGAYKLYRKFKPI